MDVVVAVVPVNPTILEDPIISSLQFGFVLSELLLWQPHRFTDEAGLWLVVGLVDSDHISNGTRSQRSNKETRTRTE